VPGFSDAVEDGVLWRDFFAYAESDRDHTAAVAMSALK
jgi:hypothetical protein